MKKGTVKITGILSGRNAARLLSVPELWAKYAHSMNKRRMGSALNHNAFGRHFVRSAIFVFGDSALVGNVIDGRFWVSHFCPATQREGIAAIRELKNHGAVGFAVTADMVGMLQKLGYKNIGITVPTNFRGQTVIKHILISG